MSVEPAAFQHLEVAASSSSSSSAPSAASDASKKPPGFDDVVVGTKFLKTVRGDKLHCRYWRRREGAEDAGDLKVRLRETRDEGNFPTDPQRHDSPVYNLE